MKNILKLFILVFILSCSKSEDTNEQDTASAICSGDYSTAGILVDIDEEIFNDDESVNAYSKYAWTSDGNDRVLSGNGIPNHQVGTFPSANNPNTITEQNVNKSYSKICIKFSCRYRFRKKKGDIINMFFL